MKSKKNPKISLEKKRLIFFEVGAIIALSAILLAFEWKTSLNLEHSSKLIISENPDYQKEVILSTPRKKELEKEKNKITLIINEVDDNVEVEEPVFWNVESTGDESFDLRFIDPFGDEEFINEDTIFIKVEEMPLFNNGKPEIEFRKYIAANLVYPQEAIDNGVEGRVTVSFVINEEGYLTDLEIVDFPHPVLSNAAMKTIQGSPPWTPGKQRTRPVKVRFYFPVIFRLN
ncbi:MAG: energy transducer TonB [Bacteroidales bacterium]